MYARLMLAALVLFAASALAGLRAGEDDPIAEQLLKDKEAFAAAQNKAKEDVLKAFDKHYETVKASKTLKVDVQLAQLEKIEAEKKAFDESGVPPTLPALKVAMSEYRTVQKKAEAAGKAAFEKAAKAYRDGGDLKSAAAVLAEMKTFMAAGAPAGTAVVVTSVLSAKVFGLADGATGDGTKVVTADYAKGDETQLWKLVPAADGWVYLENVKSGTVLAVNGTGNGTEAKLAKKKDGDERQLWKPTPVANQKGVVKLLNKGSDKVLGVDANLKTAGARILLWDDNGKPGETYTISPPK